MLVRFYEHTIRFDAYEKPTFPCIASWGDAYHRDRYDAFELVAGIKDYEVRNLCKVGICVLTEGTYVRLQKMDIGSKGLAKDKHVI